VSGFAQVTAVLAVGLITYASRAGLIVFLADRPLPANLSRALRYVGPAALSALAVNLVAGGKGLAGVEGDLGGNIGHASSPGAVPALSGRSMEGWLRCARAARRAGSERQAALVPRSRAIFRS